MRSTPPYEAYLDVVTRDAGPHGRRRLHNQIVLIYKGIEFRNRRVLDIGGGSGRHSLYAVASGAQYVLNVEPESSGAHAGVRAQFRQWREKLGWPEELVEISDQPVQAMRKTALPFDLILIHDAVNHLDEQACISLHKNADSEARYMEIFRHIAGLAAPRAEMLISDCSPVNLFPALHLKNPFDPHIEWRKHQPAELWEKLLDRVGFHRVSLRWSSPTRAGRLGRLLLSNRVAAYCYTSHFLLRLRRSR